MDMNRYVFMKPYKCLLITLSMIIDDVSLHIY